MNRFRDTQPDRNSRRLDQGKAQRRAQTLLGLELLENRQLLAFAGSAPPVWHATTQDPLDAQNGPLANAGPILIQVYKEFQTFKAAATDQPIDSFQPSNQNLQTRSGLVGISVSGYGDIKTLVNLLTASNIGMFVTAQDSQFGIVEGFTSPASFVKIASLQTQVSGQNVGVVNLSPLLKPVTMGQGVASNQAATVWNLANVLPNYTVNGKPVDGTGVTIGVISDSVNKSGSGLAGSISTGDLPSLNRINVINDSQYPGTDEGRAMMEVMYDLAPGANFAFNAGDSQVLFAQGVRDLSSAGSKVIVDDLGYVNEPFFQPGPIEQAIADVVNKSNRVYLSAAGNDASSGFGSTWRSATDTVAGISGTWMNFNPSGGTLTKLPVTVKYGIQGFTFQYDEPWYTSSGVTSQVNVYLLDSNGNVVAQGITNNVATQEPIQLVGYNGSGINAGNYTVAVNVASGPAPSRIQFSALGVGTGVVFSQQFGSQGGITYPTVFGHPAAADPVTGKIESIAVGAVPFYNAPPYGSSTPIASEDFSSFGPRVYTFTANGNRVPTQTILAPQISSIDGVNTSFFGDPPGSPVPPAYQTKYPNFFGTSCAAPDAAAIAALMLQLSPGTSEADILKAMEQSATPLNGSQAGVWDVQGGYGLINVDGALGAVMGLRVNSSTPADGSVLTSLGDLQSISFNFNKSIDPSTIKTSDLVFTGLPVGVSVSVLSVSVNKAVATFTLKVTHAPGAVANGTYICKLGGSSSSIASVDGKILTTPYTASFKVQDTIEPTILGTTLNYRSIAIQFSEPMDPATMTAANVKVLRGANLDIDVSQVAGYKVTWYPVYNGLTNVALIDLSSLPQTALPGDHYAIEVLGLGANGSGATDLVGNGLDGVFNGVFPTGDGSGTSSNFLEDLGQITLQAPYFVSLQLDPLSDTGIPGDQNTKQTQPKFVGQISALYPQTIAGLPIVVQFNALHNNALDLTQGPGGRGYSFTTSLDVQTTTDANGKFYFQAPKALPDGLLTVRVIVVGQPDQSGLQGLSSQTDKSFRVDTTNPQVASVGINGTQINNLGTGVDLTVTDPVLPSTASPIGVSTQFSLFALDPSTANNVSNYQLLNIGSLDGSSTAVVDYSGYITSGVYTDTTNRTSPTDPYTGKIHLSFAAGLPAGHYKLIARSQASGTQTGITDAAGNPIDGNANLSGAQDLTINFDLQPTPTYITNMQALSPDSAGSLTVVSGPKDYYEVPAAGQTPRAPAPPKRFYIDFSGPLNPNLDFSNLVQLIGSADKQGGTPDGNFGTDPSFGKGIGYSIVSGTTATLVNSIPGALYGQPGYLNRIQVDIAPGTTLPADYYRLYLPNTVLNKVDLRINDLFGNQIDGEFLGNPTATGSYVDLLPNGQKRVGMSGDTVAGGAFETAFLVVPNGNIIFARPDYVEDPFIPSTYADGSYAKPFPVLAPQALPNTLNGGNLNSPLNFGTGFNPNADLSGTGHFDLSAFYAASQLSKKGPVVVVTLPSLPGDPLHRTFVLQHPNQNPNLPTIPDGSASVPAETMLVMTPGTILKMYDASLYVQNQGSAIQLRGGANPSQQVIVTSYFDSSAGGNTANAGFGAVANAGDFGGILLRNYDDTSNGGRSIPITPGPDDPTRANLYGRTKLGVSGADDALSFFNFTQVRYAGGAVPNTSGYRFDAITLYNSRPSITNVTINGGQSVGSNAGPNGGSQAGISVDLDSLRADPLAQGVLIRSTTVTNTSINGIYVRAETNGIIEPTNSITYVDNPATLGGQQNYVFNNPLPYVFLARMVLGRQLLQSNSLNEQDFAPRLYVNPGMLLKFKSGSAIEMDFPTNPKAPISSMNIGDSTYIKEFDLNNEITPKTPGFKAESTTDARAVFTSFYDDKAFTQYVDPVTGVATQIVAPLDSDNGGSLYQPSPGNVPTAARWGAIAIPSGAHVVINNADFRYGGSSVNTDSGNVAFSNMLTFYGASFTGQGTTVSITNNNFTDNLRAPMTIEPDGLLAADPLMPLALGNPFFRGNVFQRNDVNGLLVQGGFLDFNSNWDDTDLTYILESTIFLAGDPISPLNPPPTPPSTLGQVLQPYNTLTLQSSMAGSLLADGSSIAKPGEPLLIKLLGGTPQGTATAGYTGSDVMTSQFAGAGFEVGIDVGDIIDPGYLSQIRITGIAGNESTGQPQVPVIITSLHDDTVGTTVRGVTMNQGITGNTTAPSPGDGGVIGIGALSLSSPNLYDKRFGSVIDNAVLKYMTRVDIQGGGLVYSDDPAGKDGAGVVGKAGLYFDLNDFTYKTSTDLQYNTSLAMTISNSVFDHFSQDAIISHTSGLKQVHYLLYPAKNTPALDRDSKYTGQAVNLYLVNNVFSNTPTAIRINADNVDAAASPSPFEAVIQNNTFYNNQVGITTSAPGAALLAHVYFTAIDNVFANSGDAAVRVVGQAYSSQLLYNLFHGNGKDTDISGAVGVASPFNAMPIYGDPAFTNALAGDFTLTANSAAIDAALSEIKQSNWGDMLQPIAIASPSGTNVRFLMGGRSSLAGGLIDFSVPGDIVSLPGLPVNQRGFNDQWFAALPNSLNAYAPFSTGGNTYWYTPTSGERDFRGYLRIDDPNKSNTGFGSRPFFDLGAFEYRQLIGPQITAVEALLPNAATNPVDPTTPNVTSIYVSGGIGGINQSPTDIRIDLSQQVDPTTVNNLTVLLQASGTDGIFGNANNSLDRYISLAGKVSYDPGVAATDTTPAISPAIIVHLGALGLNLVDDLYRITVQGTGNNVVKNTQGLALDGENTIGAGPDGTQTPLASGDGIPGGNFYVTFLVKTTAPSIVHGTFTITTDQDHYPTDVITSNNKPTFTGTIFDVPPPVNPLLGQSVYIDVSTKGYDANGNIVWDVPDAGTGTTDKNGFFSITLAKPLPDTAYNVGPDGILGTADDSGYSVARVRIVSQSGNTSNPADPNAIFSFVVDTKGPRILATSPLQNTKATVQPGGIIPVSISFPENIDPLSLSGSTIKVVRSGGDGIFGNGNDVPVSIDPVSITEEYLKSNPSGSSIVHFNIIGVNINDVYQVTLVGSGVGVTDIAGNLIDGESNKTLPSGDGKPGGDFKLSFIALDPSLLHRFFVDASQSSLNPNGTRNNAYSTIAAAMAVANIGDTIAVVGGSAASSKVVTYAETVTLKPLVQLFSANPASTDAVLLPGIAQKTVIEPDVTATPQVAVVANNLVSLPGYSARITGFTILTQLTGGLNNAPIQAASIGVAINNSDVEVDRNIIAESGTGIAVTTSDPGYAPRLYSNVIVGNITGVSVSDNKGTTLTFQGSRSDTQIADNTIAWNTNGVKIVAGGSTGLILADVVNNIFWQNADTSLARNGSAITSNYPNRITVRSNLFSSNGPSTTNPADDTVNVGGGFDPSVLVPNKKDAFGNFTGSPAFILPIDPRPDGQGLDYFLRGANYNLQSSSAAIDNGNSQAVANLDGSLDGDFLFRGRVKVTNAGLTPSDATAIVDLGAYEYSGLDALPSIKAQLISGPKVVITWHEAIAQATSFVIQRFENGVYVTIGTVNAPINSFTDVNVLPGSQYSYVVVPYYGTSAGTTSASVTINVPNLPATPTNFQVLGANSNWVLLGWTDVAPPVDGYQIYRQTGSGAYTLLATLPATASQYVDTTIVPGTTYNYEIVAFNVSGQSAPVTVTANTTLTSNQLPPPWIQSDLGAPTIPGGATLVNGVFTINAETKDPSGSSDQINFVHQTITGDAMIVARVAVLGDTNFYAKSGLMIRSSLDPSSTFAFASISPGGGSRFQWRTGTGQVANDQGGPVLANPAWIKLLREGNTFFAYGSKDGTTWTEIGAANIAMPATVEIGLAVTSYDTTLFNTSQFDHVVVSGLDFSRGISINAGGDAAGNFQPDAYSTSGYNFTTTDPVTTTGLTFPAPASVYQSAHYDSNGFNYVIPHLTPGGTYQVRLHFAELQYTQPGQRVFNVGINGSPFLTNFDIVKKTGGKDIADIEQTVVKADANGQITISFTNGTAGIPQVNGIELNAKGLAAQPVAISPTIQNTFSGVVATFTSLDSRSLPTDFTAMINWGDGSTPTPGLIQVNPAGGFQVVGTHTYTQVGAVNFTVNITGADPKLESATAAGVATVQAYPISVTPTPLTATKNTPLTGAILATFQAPGLTLPASSYQVSINWGDGSPLDTTTPTVTQSGSTFTVRGSHTYSTIGNYQATLNILVPQQGTTGNINVPTVVPISVLDAPLVVTAGPNLSANAAVPFSAAVATFVDPSGAQAPSHYLATVDWGDFTPATSATVIQNGNQFSITGSHTYTVLGNFTVNVLIHNALGQLLGSAHLLASVAPAPFTGALSAASDTGASNQDGITKINTPTYLGTAQPGSIVTLTFTPASKTGGSPVSATGQVGANGQWSVTSPRPLADGYYAVTGIASGAAPSSLNLGSLCVDNAGAKILSVQLIRSSGQVKLVIQDSLGGLNPQTLNNPASYQFAVTGSSSTGTPLTPDEIQVIPGAAPNAPQTVILSPLHGAPLNSSYYTLSVLAANQVDLAGNGLDGKFTGKVPSGSGGSGTDFAAIVYGTGGSKTKLSTISGFHITGKSPIPKTPKTHVLPNYPTGRVAHSFQAKANTVRLASGKPGHK